MYIYSDPSRAGDATALPNIEIWYEPCDTTIGHEVLPKGWYWQACFPGCLPDGEPSGPFDSEREAIEDCQGEVEADYCPLCGEDRTHPTQHGQHNCWRKG